jgi:tetratricopeptide (TPR) repeat protein
MWAPERILHTAAPELDYYIPHAHNVYLQVAAELGLVGMLAATVMLVVVGRLVLDAIRGEDAVRRRWAVVAILAAVYFGTHQLFDMFANMPAALFVFALPIAWLDATAPPREAPRQQAFGPSVRRRSVLMGAGALAVVASVGWGLASERSALEFARSQQAADDGAWSDSVMAARAAVALDPTIAAHQLGLGIAAVRTGEPSAGIAALERAADSDDLPTAWLDIASLRASAGDVPGARAALERALRLGRQQPAIAMAAGFVYETIRDTATADSVYAEAVAALPRIAGDPYWAAEGREERWPAIRDAALVALDPASQSDLWLSEGDLGRAREAASRVVDAEQRRRLELVIAAWGGDADARASLEALLVDRPRDGTLAGWCARVAAHDGDLEAAAGFRAWANTVAIFRGLLGFEVEVVDDPGAGGPVAGATWPPYGIYTYRRPTLSDHLLPGLPHLQFVERR